MNLIEDLKWRHACKRMNGTAVEEEKISRILEAINLAPTSLGLQGFKIIMVKSQEVKDRIYEQACPQLPVKECSHLLVFANYKSVTAEMLDEYFERIETQRNPGKEWCDKYRAKIGAFLGNSAPEVIENWLARQVYIALGVACTAAANERVHSVPIEGFDRKDMNKALGLDEQGLSAFVILPIGNQDIDNDWMANTTKVRKNLTELVDVL